MGRFHPVGLVVVATGTARAKDHPCQGAVEHALAAHGIDLREVNVFGWTIDRFAEQGAGGGPVDGYRFYGPGRRPARAARSRSNWEAAAAFRTHSPTAAGA